MKRLAAIIFSALLVALFLVRSPAAAAPSAAGLLGGINGSAGISGDIAYQEVSFLTGEPVLLSGTVSVRAGRPRDGREETTYTYRLENREAGVQLDRQLTLATTWQEDGNQVTARTEIARIRETVSVGRTRYTLDPDSSVWSSSSVTVQEPAVAYFAGNLEGRRVYTINRGEGQVVVEVSGDITGYEHEWGQVEIQTLYGRIAQDRTWTTQEDDTDDQGRRVRRIVTHQSKWDGTFTCQVSHTTKFDLTYVQNEPTQISFSGGYLETETQEGILRVSYDLPRLDANGEVSGSRRNQGEETFNLTGTPSTRRLPVPKFSDVRGRWSEGDITLMGSLEAWSWQQEYFHPIVPVTRREFALALARALRLEPENPPDQKSQPGGQQPLSPPLSPYRDLPVTDPEWPWLKLVSERGIMQGVAPGYFGTKSNITRAQAVTAFVRALGFEQLGPGPAYTTGFADDRDIPLWAKNSFAVAREIGLVSGDTYGRARPNAYLTREEAATLLARLVRYLQHDILRDYRDRIFLFD